MPLTKPQQKIFSDNSRFRVVSAGRRFGKTFLSMYEIARIARYPNKNIFYVAPTYRQGKQIIWEDLKQQLIQRRWVKKINESELTISLVNGSRISVRSADNPDSMRGVSLDFAVLDECAFMDKSVWTEVLRPTLSDKQGGALMISTPRGFNWFYDMWQFGKSNDDWESFKFTTIEGGNVLPEEVEAAKADLDQKTFEQEYEASFENAGHIIYYAFDMDENTQQHNSEVPKIIHVGCDFNVNPMSAVIAQQTPNGLHVFDEISLPNSNTDELASEIHERYGKHKIVVYPDPAGNARKTSSNRTDHRILEEWGFVVKAKRSHPSVKDRINAVNRLFCDANGDRHLYIDPRCREVIKCVTKHQYKEGTVQPEKDSGFDHMNDALGYMVDYMYPIRKPAAEPLNRNNRFGHF